MLPRAFAAFIALLIGAALLWVITAGPDDQAAGERPTSALEKKAVRVEKRLAKDPNDEKLLLATMYAWIGAGSARFEAIDPDAQPIPSAMPEDYKAGLRAWNGYLRQTGGKAGVRVAEYVGAAFFSLVEIGSTDPSEAEANAAGAVRAEKIAVKHEPGMYTLSDLAVYEYFNGEFAAGDRAAREAAADIAEKGGLEPRDVIGQLNEYKERGEKFQRRLKRGVEALEETGEEELENPIKAYGAPAGINGYEPGDGPGS